MNILDHPLGEIARKIPGATTIFHRHQIDFCCAGNKTLREAANSKLLDVETLTAELEQLPNLWWPDEDFDDASNEALIEYILTRYNDAHRWQLPELIRLARRVELVHGGHATCPAGLTYCLEQMQEALEEHMRKEEQTLFPMIARGMLKAAIHPVAVMRRQHDDLGKALEHMLHITHGLALPADACGTWRMLYLELETLRHDLIDHIHMENNILFNRIDGLVEHAHCG